MPTPFTFRLSNYLTLVLACLCLTYAEYDLLPEVVGFAGLTFVLMAVSFRREDRSSGFSHRQANTLGTGITLIAVVWLAWQSTQKNSLIRTMNLPSGLLPYLGAVLLLLMPAKLLRPKHVGDWWAIQGIGLATAGLACAISDEGLFGLLFALYCGAAVWSVGLFFLLRRAGRLPPSPGEAVGPPPAVVGEDGRRFVGRSLGWAAGAGAVAVTAFLSTPPAGVERWQFGKPHIETGYAGDVPVELGRAGEMYVNRDEAFEVTATGADGQPKEDLDPAQLWRGTAYFDYEDGRGQWKPGQMMIYALARPPGWTREQWQQAREQGVLPDLGPGAYLLEYKPSAKLAGAVLAAPVVWAPGQVPPAASIYRGQASLWVSASDGSFKPSATWNGVLRPFKQTTRPPAEAGLGTGFEIPPARTDPIQPLRTLTGVPKLKAWARAKVGEFVGSGKLPADVLRRADDRVTLRIDPADHEAVARAFRDYFARSGEFKYDMKLRQDDKAADPVEDFVFATKTGHCERFAAALALSLRAVDIPAAFVTGFRGCEHQGGGRYVVRQENAHAWTEVLVRRPAPPGYPTTQPTPPAEIWHWLTLDATPDAADEVGERSALGQWFGSVRSSGAQLYADFIIGYNPDRRQMVAAAVADHLTATWPAYAAAAAVILALAGTVRGTRWWGRRTRARARAGTGVAWYDEFRAALAGAGFPVRPGQTPAEYADAVATTLRADPRTAPLAATPGDVTRAFYEVRYAGRPLTPERDAELGTAVREFAAQLPTASQHTSK